MKTNLMTIALAATAIIGLGASANACERHHRARVVRTACIQEAPPLCAPSFATMPTTAYTIGRTPIMRQTFVTRTVRTTPTLVSAPIFTRTVATPIVTRTVATTPIVTRTVTTTPELIAEPLPAREVVTVRETRPAVVAVREAMPAENVALIRSEGRGQRLFVSAW